MNEKILLMTEQLSGAATRCFLNCHHHYRPFQTSRRRTGSRIIRFVFVVGCHFASTSWLTLDENLMDRSLLRNLTSLALPVKNVTILSFAAAKSLFDMYPIIWYLSVMMFILWLSRLRNNSQLLNILTGHLHVFSYWEGRHFQFRSHLRWMCIKSFLLFLISKLSGFIIFLTGFLSFLGWEECLHFARVPSR